MLLYHLGKLRPLDDPEPPASDYLSAQDVGDGIRKLLGAELGLQVNDGDGGLLGGKRRRRQ